MRVLISGAGVAGPALAWFLAKTGSRVTVVEKANSLMPVGQNIDVNGTALSVIKKMGLLGELRRLNTTEKGTQFVDENGHILASFPLNEGGAVSPTSEYEILRGDLAKMLADASMESPNVEYKLGTTITKVLSNDDNSVKVELSNGEVDEYDLLVAADGQWSRTRKQCFSPEDVTVVDKGMYAIYWTLPRLPTDNDMWILYQALRSRILSIRPDPHGTMRAAFTYMPCNEAQKQAWESASRGGRQEQNALVRSEFADAGWIASRLLDSMDQATDFYFHSIKQTKMSRWSTSRVVCLGDAAYAPTPLTGAGANLALLGAYVLAGELGNLEKGEHLSKALEAYERTFRPFVEETQQVPSIFPGVAHPATAWKRSVFRAVIWVLSKIAAISWIGWRHDESKEDASFPLPQYSSFAALESSSSDVEKH
jgi:2-polyprenyl-6-methoxyphenol hydroxylase-like FAD-dependent oxidoreductase